MTERLTYRPPQPGDERHYEVLTGSPEVGTWLRPPPLDPFGPGDAELWFGSDSEHWREHGFGPWLLFVGDEFVGRAGVRWTEVDGRAEIELAWAVLPRWWGQGFATEAARAAVALARERGIEKLVAFTMPTNLASRRVMEKLGMEFVADIEHAGLPHVLYELWLA